MNKNGKLSYASKVDPVPRKTLVPKELLEELENDILRYDADTSFDIPNFCPGKYAVNKGKKEFMGYIYDEFIKVPEANQCFYDYVLVNNGKVIAMGDERGRCGGISRSCKDADFEKRLKGSPCYDKVKHLPIATKDELEEPIYKYFQTEREYEEYIQTRSRNDFDQI